jgi:hypothetical protein
VAYCKISVGGGFKEERETPVVYLMTRSPDTDTMEKFQQINKVDLTTARTQVS